MWIDSLSDMMTKSSLMRGFMAMWLLKAVAVMAIEVGLYITVTSIGINIFLPLAGQLRDHNTTCGILFSSFVALSTLLLTCSILVCLKTASRAIFDLMVDSVVHRLMHTPEVCKVSGRILAEIARFRYAVAPPEQMVKKIVAKLAINMLLGVVTPMRGEIILRCIVHTVTRGYEVDDIPRGRTMDVGG